MKILYFTATGNNLYVAKKIGEDIYSIPKMVKQNVYEIADEKVGIVFPIYELGVPKYVEEFLDRVKIDSSYIFVIMTYGMYDGSAISHLKKIANRNNIQLSYINTLIMIDNYLPVYKIEEQLETEERKNIETQIANIRKDLELKVNKIPRNNIKTKLLTRYARKKVFPKRDKKLGIYKKSFDKVFCVESTCISCGICEKVCPVNNIVVKEEPDFKGECIGCLSCTHNCPQNSIRVIGEKSKKRFRNSNVSLKEIIESNQ